MNDKIGQSPLPKCTKEYLLCLELNSEPVCTELFKHGVVFMCVCIGSAGKIHRYTKYKGTRCAKQSKHLYWSSLEVK